MPDHNMSDVYFVNPEVVLREEDQDGGLLFNPDTNQVRVLNSTGLFIWKSCDGRQDLGSILERLKTAFHEVPENDVFDQVEVFINDLKTHGFLNILED